MELMTEFHKYPDNSIRIDNINGKGCITESIAISKSGKYAYVTLYKYELKPYCRMG